MSQTRLRHDGKVEKLVKCGRRQFLTPVPVMDNYDALNAKLAADCRARQADCSGRNSETIGARLAADLAGVKLLIIDELGYVPLSPTGAELLFEVFSQRSKRASTIITSNLPFEEWTSVLSSERLTGALLDRLPHHVHILEVNGDSYRRKHACGNRRKAAKVVSGAPVADDVVDPDTGEATPA